MPISQSFLDSVGIGHKPKRFYANRFVTRYLLTNGCTTVTKSLISTNSIFDFLGRDVMLISPYMIKWLALLNNKPTGGLGSNVIKNLKYAAYSKGRSTTMNSSDGYVMHCRRYKSKTVLTTPVETIFSLAVQHENKLILAADILFSLSKVPRINHRLHFKNLRWF